MENKYCATVRSCEQTSPDDWEMITRTLGITDETTIKQIADWHKSMYPNSGHLHIVITNLSTPLP